MPAASARRHRKRRLKAEINVVPYIDVMLVLLIIFMVTAPLLNLGTDIQLPESHAKSLVVPKEPVVVSLYADGRYALMIERDNREVGAEELTAKLGALRRQNPQLTVLVRGDRDASYQTIMAGIDLINAAGVSKVSLISLPAEGRD
ncbi:ExbD/TolR family protein [Vulcaniibacterium gelatinicum]|uniref:ExbD/TolR family protein n=1 Tax=Vulcaniibacterium gelatinicum TaxID=2598725 RepID=UPI0011CB0C81|nr:ExbD/TolR family protein [Vulcaniibacterium gelatinicum]